MTAEASAAPGRASLEKEAFLASLGVLLLLGAVKHAAGFPVVGPYLYAVAAAAQLYFPLWLIGRRGVDHDFLGLRLDTWRRDLWLALLLGIATMAPFFAGHHLWQTVVLHRRFLPRLPAELLSSVATQLIAVALPEELFFRGYLQRRFEQLWPAKRRLFGAPFGWAVLAASAVFAFAHFVGEYRVMRLGPFFPALLFGLLRTKTGSLVAPISYHAFCNILSDALWGCYQD